MINNSDEICRENQNTSYIPQNSSENLAGYKIMWQNKVEPDGPHRIIKMRKRDAILLPGN